VYQRALEELAPYLGRHPARGKRAERAGALDR